MSIVNIAEHDQSVLRQALDAIRDLRARLAEVEHREPIAIIGMACHFPGASNVDEYWDLLLREQDGVSASHLRFDEVPPDIGGLIETDRFDADFFGISYREAERMDPQQRVFLEVAWEGLQHAGLSKAALKGSNTGVFVGVLNYNSDFGGFALKGGTEVNAFAATSVSHSILTGRLSYALDLRGPNVAVDTACSSSLVAVHQACSALRARECNMAVAGGVNLLLDGDIAGAIAQMQLLSGDCRCKPFDATADGIVRSEGCGVVVLKRLNDAIAHGDQILAVIKGSAINHNGRSNGITAPNGNAQVSLLNAALASADLSGHDVQYVEAHGTGTVLGDPIEVDAIRRVFGGPERPAPLIIGSAKSNLGHCEAAAGVAGLIKAVMVLRNGVVPPQLYLKSINPLIDLAASQVQFSLETAPLRAPNGLQASAGVSSFGWSGTNAHVILQAAPKVADIDTQLDVVPQVVTLSAPSEIDLGDHLKEMIRYLRNPGGAKQTLADIAYTANVRTDHHRFRVAAIGATQEDVARGLEKLSQARTFVDSSAPGKLTFVFSGQGDQWPGMVDDLTGTAGTFRDTLLRCDEIARESRAISVLEALKSGSSIDLSRTEIAQPCVVSVQIALFEHYKALGIVPEIVLGHSVGEVSAAYAGGALSLEDAIGLALARGNAMADLRARGVMIATDANVDQCRSAIEDFDAIASIAAINGPNGTVIAVDQANSARFVQLLQGLRFRGLVVNPNYAFHSHQVDSVTGSLHNALVRFLPRPSSIPIISTVTGQMIPGESLDASYWVRNARQTVNFMGAVEQAIAHGGRTFLELGPHPVLVGHINGLLRSQQAEGLAVGSLYRGRPQQESLLEGLGALYCRGLEPVWSLLQSKKARFVRLPLLPWKKETFHGRRLARPAMQAEPALSALAVGSLMDWTWDADTTPLLLDHVMFDKIVVPGAVHIATLLSPPHGQAFEPGEVRDVTFHQPLIIDRADRATVTLRRSTDSRGGQIYQLEAIVNARSHEPLLLSSGTSMPINDQEAAAARMPREMMDASGADWFFAWSHSRGLQLGPSFRWIEQIDVKGYPNVALCRLVQQPDSMSDSGLAIQPGLIDSCFQALLAVHKLKHDLDDIFIPLSVESFKLYRPIGKSGWATVALTASGQQSGELIVGDFQLFNDKGDLVASARGVVLKRASHDALMRRRSLPKQINLYAPHWLPAAIAAASKNLSEGLWIVVGDEGDTLAPFIVDRLAQRGRAARLAQRVGIDELFGERSSTPIAGVVRLCAERAVPDATGDKLLELEYGRCADLLDLFRTMVTSEVGRTANFWVVTSPLEGEIPTTPRSSIWGLGRTIRSEFEEHWGGHVDIARSSSPEADAARICDELLGNGEEHEVAIDNGVRQVLRPQLIPFTLIDKPARLSGLKLYVIIGGFGNLGLALAQALVVAGARHLLLVGRSAPSLSSQALMAELRLAGTVVTTFQADITSAGDVSALFRFMARSNKDVGGIFNLAGVVQDSSVMNISHRQLSEVLAPKVAGAWNLHRHAVGVAMDHFVVFSSLSGIVGNPGQAAYSAANSFLDNLMKFRRDLGLPGISLALGPISDIGMAARLDDNQIKQLADRGINFMPAKAGLAAALSALQLAEPTVVIAAIGLDALVRLHSGQRFEGPVRPAAPSSVAGLAWSDFGSMTQQERQLLLLQFLMNEVQKVTSGSHFSETSPLSSIGLDSLSAVTITQALRTKVGANFPITILFDSDSLAHASARIAQHFDSR